MKGKPRWAVNMPTDIEASDEWLASLTASVDAHAGDGPPQTARTEETFRSNYKSLTIL